MPKRPVAIDVKDGITVRFDSITRASNYLEVDESSVRKSISRNHKCCGHKFRYDD